MKKHKNIFLSLGSYELFFVWYCFFVYVLDSHFHLIVSTPSDPTNAHFGVYLLFIPCLITIIMGIYFAFKSVRYGESSWMGKVIGSIGIIALLVTLYLFYMFWILSTAIF
jgi:glucan phosphoethanolaminetransferase (alkaline phosphatase superfamily)